MRQLPVFLREEAIADLEEVYDFIVGNGGPPEVAIGFVRRMRARCDKIGFAPEGGVARPDLGIGIRLVPFEKTAVIAYRLHDDAVEVVNVFYGGRDYEALMK
jgi:toxin ParE1/3/4